VKRVLTAAVLIPLVILALFRAPLWLFTLLVLGVALLAAKEYINIAKATGFQPFEAVIYFFLLLSFGFMSYESTYAASDYSPDWLLFAALALISPFVFLACGLARDQLAKALSDSAVSLLVLPYVGLSLIFLVLLRTMDSGALYVLFLMLLVWCGDIAAYYVGRAIGRRKLAPHISPGKTWEGAIASVVGAVAVALLLFHFINPIANALRSVHLLISHPLRIGSSVIDLAAGFPIAPVWLVASFAVCVNVAAQLGDLVESALKRGAGLKDSGTLLPGHGGVLDRIDALLFALPVGLLFYSCGLGRYFAPLGVS